MGCGHGLARIDNRLTNHDFEHQQGYGYRDLAHPTQRLLLLRMGSQLAVCLPERDPLLVTTGDTQDPDTTEILEASGRRSTTSSPDELARGAEAQRRLSVLTAWPWRRWRARADARRSARLGQDLPAR